MNMPLETFLTALYTTVDGWYKEKGVALLAGKASTKPLFTDSEVLTLSLAQHWLGFADERQWLRCVKNNYLPLFPPAGQSKPIQPPRPLPVLADEPDASLYRAGDGGAFAAEYRLVDGTPITIRHWRRYGKGHLRCASAPVMLPGAEPGYCASNRPLAKVYLLRLSSS